MVVLLSWKSDTKKKQWIEKIVMLVNNNITYFEQREPNSSGFQDRKKHTLNSSYDCHPSKMTVGNPEIQTKMCDNTTSINWSILRRKILKMNHNTKKPDFE